MKYFVYVSIEKSKIILGENGGRHQTFAEYSNEQIPCSRDSGLLGVRTTNAMSKRGMISALVRALRGRMIDLEQQENEFNICIFKHGKKEEFETNRGALNPTVSQEPRWFSFGPDQMDIKKQLAIMKAVTGEAPRMDNAIAEQRKKIWRAWYRNDSTIEFQTRKHLPTIAREFRGEWEAVIPVDNDVSMHRFFRAFQKRYVLFSTPATELEWGRACNRDA